MPAVAAPTKPKWADIAQMEFEPDVFSKYVYVLNKKNQVREAPVFLIDNGRQYPYNGKDFKPYQNLLLSSSIIWDGQAPKPYGWDAEGRPAKGPGRRMIRYYDGCTTLFVDEQPKEQHEVERLIQSTRQMWFNNGEIEVMGYDKMLKLYCDICSYNAESPYRVPNADAIFRPINPEKDAAETANNIDMLEKALAYAKDAGMNKMKLHANYLGVPEVDLATNRPLSEAALRAAYRKKATENPALFLQSYDNKAIELKYWIEKAIEKSVISFSVIPNSAAWKESGAIICDMSGFSSHDGKVQRLVEFASLGEGEQFAAQLKAMFKE